MLGEKEGDCRHYKLHGLTIWVINPNCAMVRWRGPRHVRTVSTSDQYSYRSPSMSLWRLLKNMHRILNLQTSDVTPHFGTTLMFAPKLLLLVACLRVVSRNKNLILPF
jgi:hypothetical protein